MAQNDSSSTSMRGRLVGAISHVLFIVIIFVLPELVMQIALPHRRPPSLFPGFYIKSMIYIAVFYANYFLIIEKTVVDGFDRRRLIAFIGWNILVVGVGLFLSHFMSHLVFPSPRRPVNVSGSHALLKTASFLLRDLVMLVLTIALAVALRLSAKWKDLQRQRQELLANQRSTELDSLKSQLNPHFLFNTLNTIYALIAINGADAQNAVHRLSSLLRYMLYEDVDNVRLGQEAEFIENYVSLMRLRLFDREVRLSIDLGSHSGDCIAPLLFIPLVENAFKYGTAASDNTPVDIAIFIENNCVVCTTSNAYNTARPVEVNRNSGIGLTNLRRRLSLLYGTKATFGTWSDGNIFTTRLCIPLQTD